MTNYTEDNIKTLDWQVHLRRRPGMYVGRLGDGSSPDDGIYILLKEVIDNSIDEFNQGVGKTIDITIKENCVSVRDYGRGIPLEKAIDCVSKMNTGGKFDSEVFQQSVGMNGVGTKAVNALSSYFKVQSIRDGRTKVAEFSRGILTQDYPITTTTEHNGTIITFIPDNDESIFGNYTFYSEFVEKMLWNYAFLNKGLTLTCNGQKYYSKNGLLDLMTQNISQPAYPIIHLQEDKLELALTHKVKGNGDEYFSFVNGQHTTHGGTHQNALREALVKCAREYFKKEYDPIDVRQSICAAISIRIQEPQFEGQTKTKLGSTNMWPANTEKGIAAGPTIRWYVMDIVCRLLDNYLHMHPDVAAIWQQKIIASENERKEIADLHKKNKDGKKNNIVNKKLRDCHIHMSDTFKGKNAENDHRMETTLFITEGDSASGSITKSRNAETQAVFSLRGKPFNSYGKKKDETFKNEELNFLQAALDIEDGLDNLRYNNIVIATDADVDGMHIRLLLLTFFLQFYPELIKKGHLYILQTPLFRVRNKKETRYCYSEEERNTTANKLTGKVEITRFKGLGEISPDEFKHFIGKDIRLDPVVISDESTIDDMLAYYMGQNSMERQNFIIDNLRIEEDLTL